MNDDLLDHVRDLWALLDTLPKCPFCGHTGPVTSHSDHWNGCSLEELLVEVFSLVPGVVR